MSVPLTAEEEANYTAIIDAILADADLTTVTRKVVRVGLEEALGGKDLSEQKSAIKKLIEARFDAISGSQDESPPAPSSPPERPQVNGHNKRGSPKKIYNGKVAEGDSAHADAHAEPAGEDMDGGPPKKKPRRTDDSFEDADAKLAAQLQAQENSLARSRTTRGSSGVRGGTPTKGAKAKAKAQSARRQKSAKKVKAEDDSDVEAAGSDAEPKKRKAGGGFQKPFTLSDQLCEVCGGETQLSRPQVVKKLWGYIKDRGLQDANDKRQIICDEKLQAVFNSSRINMFTMNKSIGSHLYPVEEE